MKSLVSEKRTAVFAFAPRQALKSGWSGKNLPSGNRKGISSQQQPSLRCSGLIMVWLVVTQVNAEPDRKPLQPFQPCSVALGCSDLKGVSQMGFLNIPFANLFPVIIRNLFSQWIQNNFAIITYVITGQKDDNTLSCNGLDSTTVL